MERSVMKSLGAFSPEDLVHKQTVIFVNSLPETGDNRYIYGVIMPEETRDGYPIAQLFIWDNDNRKWYAQKAYPIGVDPNNILLKTAITIDANNVVTIDLGD